MTQQRNPGIRGSFAGIALAGACSLAGTAIAASPPAPPAAPLKGRAEQGAIIANQTCAACHGPGGNPTMPDYPRLAGQIPEYLAKQLRAFQAPAGQRAHRSSPIMQPLAAALKEQQILDVAAYYAQQRPLTAKPRDPARVEAGKKIYFSGNPSNDLPACASCHRADGRGMAPDFPALAGQQPAYLANQLRHWEANRGGRGKLMTMIAPHLRPEDIEAVADFLAQMR